MWHGRPMVTMDWEALERMQPQYAGVRNEAKTACYLKSFMFCSKRGIS